MAPPGMVATWEGSGGQEQCSSGQGSPEDAASAGTNSAQQQCSNRLGSPMGPQHSTTGWGGPDAAKGFSWGGAGKRGGPGRREV